MRRHRRLPKRSRRPPASGSVDRPHPRLWLFLRLVQRRGNRKNGRERKRGKGSFHLFTPIPLSCSLRNNFFFGAQYNVVAQTSNPPSKRTATVRSRPFCSGCENFRRVCSAATSTWPSLIVAAIIPAMGRSAPRARRRCERGVQCLVVRPGNRSVAGSTAPLGCLPPR